MPDIEGKSFFRLGDQNVLVSQRVRQTGFVVYIRVSVSEVNHHNIGAIDVMNQLAGNRSRHEHFICTNAGYILNVGGLLDGFAHRVEFRAERHDSEACL